MNDTATNHGADDPEWSAWEAKINAILPPQYVGRFEDVSPTSMGSAALRYDSRGRVAWGEIWTTFCHLALAGGPPHRGRWLGPVTADEANSAPEAYEAVVAELRRAFQLCVGLPVIPRRRPGWIGLQCDDGATAAWLARAIVAENVVAEHDGSVLFVPAGPGFRIEKEIKNVVVSVAKTCHYLLDHLDPERRPTVEPRRLIRPPSPEEVAAASERYEQAAAKLEAGLRAAAGLTTRRGEAPGWVGVECGGEDHAVWLLRAVAAADVLVRREGSTLFVPVDLRAGDDDPIGLTVAAVAGAERLRRHRARKE